MEFINLCNPVFNELFCSLNGCNKWGFYGLSNQLFFVRKAINEWANKNKIDDTIKQEMITSAETVFKPSFYILHTDMHYIDANEPEDVDVIFKQNKYHVIQLSLYERIQQVQKMILEIIIKKYVIISYF